MNIAAKSFWFQIYRNGASFVGGLITAGNLSTVAYLALNDSDVGFCAVMAVASVGKGITYATIWPVFVPYACIKATRKPYYIGSKFGKINDNGFAPHIIPGWKAATEHLR